MNFSQAMAVDKIKLKYICWVVGKLNLGAPFIFIKPD